MKIKNTVGRKCHKGKHILWYNYKNLRKKDEGTEPRNVCFNAIYIVILFNKRKGIVKVVDCQHNTAKKNPEI